jgi:hypothetical protein
MGSKGNGMLGEQMQETIDHLRSLPPDQFKKEFSDIVHNINGVSTGDALDFAQAVLGFNKNSYNIQSAVDVASLLPVDKLLSLGSKAKKSTEAVSDFKRVLEDTLNTAANQGSKPDIAAMASSAGKTDTAATVGAINNLKAEFYAFRDAKTAGLDGSTKAQAVALTKHIPSYADPFKILKGSYRLDREAADRLMNKVIGLTEASMDSVSDIPRVERVVSEQAQAQFIADAKTQLTKEYGHINDTVMDITHVPAEVSPANVHSLNIDFKQPNGIPFTSREQANYWANNEFQFKEPYAVVPQGDGYFVRLTRDVDETTSSVRDLLIDTNNTTPKSFFSGPVSGYTRSADNFLPKANNEVRQTVVHGVSTYNRYLSDIAQPIRDLSPKSTKSLNRFLESMRDYVKFSPEGVADRGRFFNTQGDFEEAWTQLHGKLPNENESAAYWSYIKLYDTDYFHRNLSVYTAKVRQGIQSFRLELPDNPVTWPDTTFSDTFDGKHIFNSKLSDLDNRSGILVWDPVKNEKTYVTKRELTEDSRKALQDSLDTGGYQMIQVVDWSNRPLKDAVKHEGFINYVITKNYEKDRLPWKQLDYDPGGHVAYDYNLWLKQPRVFNVMERKLYQGDRTIRPINTDKEGKKLEANYNTARRLFNSKDQASFDVFVRNNLPETPMDVWKAFEDGTLDAAQPFKLIRKGTRTIDDPVLKDGLGTYEDIQKSPFTLSGGPAEYLGERDLNLNAARVDFSESNPVFQA